MEREHIIKEIHDLTERIKSNASNDVDMLLADVAHLYEMAILLKHLPEEVKTNGQSHVVMADALPVQKEEVKVQEKPQATIDLFSQETPPAEVVVKVSPKEEDPEGATPPPAPKKEAPKEPSKKKVKESVAEKLQHNKITDLKAAIGINEKFQFINELFDGNMKEYTVAVDQINNFASFSEADSYLANLKEMYKWDGESAVSVNFEELVQRRFTS